LKNGAEKCSQQEKRNKKMGILNKITDSLKTSEFDVKANMKVKSLQRNFKKSFGCELRIYHGKKFANPGYTIAKIRPKDKRGSGEEFKARASWKVKRLEKQFKDSFGITVQVAKPGNEELADNSHTLGKVSRS
jgi:hypothetical protein|tara:strand:+ start:299 stop:697 length:399 start_codon:yes stop_codon:yes gene_type:complete